jgi:hypothetical protein
MREQWETLRASDVSCTLSSRRKDGTTSAMSTSTPLSVLHLSAFANGLPRHGHPHYDDASFENSCTIAYATRRLGHYCRKITRRTQPLEVEPLVQGLEKGQSDLQFHSFILLAITTTRLITLQIEGFHYQSLRSCFIHRGALRLWR